MLVDHVCLDVECVDRLYLNGYVPDLQVGGQVVRSLCEHLGNAIPSGAILGRIGEQSVVTCSVRRSPSDPADQLAKGERKIERMKPLLARRVAGGGVRWARRNVSVSGDQLQPAQVDPPVGAAVHVPHALNRRGSVTAVLPQRLAVA